MKIIEALETVDKLVSNTYDTETKIKWLSAIDAFFQRELVERHEGGVPRDTNYTVSDLDTELIAPSPYDEVYISWLTLKIHYFNGEVELYNNAAENYGNQLYEFKKWYVRTHRDLPTPKIHSWGVKSKQVSTDSFNRIMASDNQAAEEVSKDVSAE